MRHNGTTSSKVAIAVGAGALLGVLFGAVRGAVLLTSFGFWVGLMWPLLLGGPLALWFASKRLRAMGEAISFAVGLASGLAPWAWYAWYVERDLNGNEVWFPVTLAFLLGLLLSPAFVALRRSKFSAPVT